MATAPADVSRFKTTSPHGVVAVWAQRPNFSWGRRMH
jgi:hypothetical protein